MDEVPPPNATAAAPVDPLDISPRELMRELLPAARRQYVKAWELLADASTALDRRRLARVRVKSIAADHSATIDFLREHEATFTGDERSNARHLASELERHVEALEKLATISARGLIESVTLRPDTLGCGKRFRVPAQPPDHASGASRLARSNAAAKPRDPREQRREDRPFSDRGPKAPRDALGTSKHPSTLGDTLDEETRAQLAALRQDLEP